MIGTKRRGRATTARPARTVSQVSGTRAGLLALGAGAEIFGCGLPEGGFARIRCDACGNEYLVAFSCNQRGFCPSCCVKRAALWVEFVRERVVRSVPHRHLVFALPKVLRPAFRYRRRLLPKLALCAWKALSSFLREDTGGDALPAAIVSIQTAGEFLNWHPHLHVLAPAAHGHP